MFVFNNMINTSTIDFRRKILTFNGEIGDPYQNQCYIKSDVPKFYSSFFETWRPEYIGKSNCEDTHPDYYPIQYPIRGQINDPTVCYTQKTINPMEDISITRLIAYLIIVVIFGWLFSKTGQ